MLLITMKKVKLKFKLILFVLFSLMFFCNESLSFAKKTTHYANFLGTTSIGLGYQERVITRLSKDNSVEGSAWLLKFPLNTYLDLKVLLNNLKTKGSTYKLRYFLVFGGLILQLSPKSNANPFISLGVLSEKKEDLVANSTKNGAGFYVSLGIEFILGKYTSLILSQGYLRDFVLKDEGFKTNFMVNACYEWMCSYFRTSYTSKRDFWNYSENLALELGIRLQFSIVKLLKEVNF